MVPPIQIAVGAIESILTSGSGTTVIVCTVGVPGQAVAPVVEAITSISISMAIAPVLVTVNDGITFVLPVIGSVPSKAAAPLITDH